MGRQVAVVLSDDELARLDAAIAAGAYPSRPAVLRAGLRTLLDASSAAPGTAPVSAPLQLGPWTGDRRRFASPALLRRSSPARELAREVAVPILTSAAMTVAGRVAGSLLGRVGARVAQSVPRGVPPPVPPARPEPPPDPQWSRAAYRSTVELFLVRRPSDV